MPPHALRERRMPKTVIEITYLFFSKRSPMPSLQESVTPDAEYVNTDVISEMIKQEEVDQKNVAEIIQIKGETHVCNIKIKDESKPPPKPNQPKRSLSSVSSSRPGQRVG